MNPQLAFQPSGSDDTPPTCSVQLAVTTGVQQIALNTTGITNGTMRIVVSGTSNVAWCYGANASLTMANGIVMLPNTVEVFALPSSVTQLSVIGASVGSTIVICSGDGL